MSGAETARRRVVQRQIDGAEMALPPYTISEWGGFFGVIVRLYIIIVKK